MCTTHIENLIVEQPLTVYKVILHKVNDKAIGPDYISPFYKKPISKSNLDGFIAYEADGQGANFHWDPDFKTYAAKGFVHAYHNLDDACNDFGFYIENFATGTYIPELWECEIPPKRVDDKTYYCVTGIFDTQEELHCVAARRIYFRKMIDYGVIAERRKAKGKHSYVKKEIIINKLSWKEKTENS